MRTSEEIKQFIEKKERNMYKCSYMFLKAYRDGYLHALDTIARYIAGEE